MNTPYAVKTGIGIFLKNFQRNIYEKNWKKIWSVQKMVVSLHQKLKRKRYGFKEKINKQE